MRLVRGKLLAKLRHPGGTGYHVDLYKTAGVPPENAHDLETRFMSPLDNDAATAVQMMLRGTIPAEPRYRQAWARFLVSMLFRHRESVETLKTHVAKMWDEGTAALESVWAEHRKPTDPATFAEATTLALGNRAGPDAANMLADIIANTPAVTDIMNMFWCVADVSGASRTLLTSDRALVMPLGLADKLAYLALPISPAMVFIAAYDNRFQTVKNKSQAVSVMNMDVVRQAREFVWGTDDSQWGFVEKNIAKLADRAIITEEQKQEAIRAARGETAPP